jgi:DNA-binding response OmpR family regulator
MRVLYVDDDIDDLIMLEEAMREVDNTVSCITAQSGREALNLLVSSGLIPEIIILDINMPDMTGWDCVVEVKKHARLSKTLLVILTTAVSHTDKEHAALLGVPYLFKKPNTVSELMSIVRTVLEQGRKLAL